jgi:hypothetical protein
MPNFKSYKNSHGLIITFYPFRFNLHDIRGILMMRITFSDELSFNN